MRAYASVALVDPRGWVLMQERDEHPVVDPDRWGFPGGGVEPGESFEDAAYRELAEETGIRLHAGLELLDVHEADLDRVGRVACRLFGATTSLTDDDVVCGEGRRMVFVDPATIGDLPLTTTARLSWPVLRASHLLDRRRDTR